MTRTCHTPGRHHPQPSPSVPTAPLPPSPVPVRPCVPGRRTAGPTGGATGPERSHSRTAAHAVPSVPVCSVPVSAQTTPDRRTITRGFRGRATKPQVRIPLMGIFRPGERCRRPRSTRPFRARNARISGHGPTHRQIRHPYRRTCP